MMDEKNKSAFDRIEKNLDRISLLLYLFVQSDKDLSTNERIVLLDRLDRIKRDI